MAYAIDITKQSVTKVMDGMYNITLNLKCMDGEIEVINEDVTEDHRMNKSVAYTVGKFLIRMQAIIDGYKEEQSIFNSATLDNAIVVLENNLEG